MKKTILYLRTDIMNQELIAGGSVSHTLGVIEGFATQGFDIVCAASCMYKILQNNNHIKNCIQLKNPRFLQWLRWRINCLLSNIFFTFTIFKHFHTTSITYIYQRYSLLNATGIILRFFLKKPLILEYNGSEVWVNRHWGEKTLPFFDFIAKKIESLNIHYADYVVVVSDALKNELISRSVYKQKILVNPNGVNPTLYNPQTLISQRNTVRTELNLQKKFVFGFIGTFSHWHGINILEKLIPELVQLTSQVHFLLIGDGPLRESLQKVIIAHKLESHVTFTGILPSCQARNYLAACDAFLSPNQPNPDGSRFFGSPTKLFEYMSLAKPIIASHIEQIITIVKPALHIDMQTKNISSHYKYACGFLLKPHDVDGFVRACYILTKANSNSVKVMGLNARQRILACYSWHHHVKKITTFITQKKGTL